MVLFSRLDGSSNLYKAGPLLGIFVNEWKQHEEIIEANRPYFHLFVSK